MGEGEKEEGRRAKEQKEKKKKLTQNVEMESCSFGEAVLTRLRNVMLSKTSSRAVYRIVVSLKKSEVVEMKMEREIKRDSSAAE